MSKSLAKLILLSFLVLTLTFTTGSTVPMPDNNTNPVTNYKQPADSIKNTNDNLPVVGSMDKLKDLIKTLMSMDDQSYADGNNSVSKSASPKDTVVNSAAAKIPESDYSTTNLQVNGVDEGDIIKTDGNYIYQISQNRLVITKAYPSKDMKIASITNIADKNFNPSEIYIDGTWLVLIGMSIDTPSVYRDSVSPGNKPKSIAPFRYKAQYSTKAIIYDISSREKINEIRQIKIDGSLLASRKIGSKLYLVCSKYFGNYASDIDVNETIPSYSDSVSSEKTKTIGLDKIKYFPEASGCNYLIIGTVDTAAADEMTVNAYLGSGEDLYMSQDNMYIAVTKYNKKTMDSSTSGSRIGLILPPIDFSTAVYKFALNGGKVSYSASVSIPGRVLNQFSMDEYDGSFRIATTELPDYRADSMSNNVYILDNKLKVTGKLENIAPGEKIYSVRFMGKRGYLVTFKNVDPLFALDLSTPDNPKILGELKIPGYSNYLHPYDENHIIGFGKDTIEVPGKDINSKKTSAASYYLGMKISLFDVTDVKKPVELYTQTIGDRGTDSEILSNHKALLFSKDKNLLSFPVTEYLLKNSSEKMNKYGNFPEYGQFAFQGAYVYNIDLKTGFTLKGRITHMPYVKNNPGQYADYNYYHINRIIYIKNTLYTLSDGKITASDMSNLNKTGEIEIDK